MITFRLLRTTDETGVSGTGHVADGVRFHDGATVIRWRTPHATTTVYATIEDVIHIHTHGGYTAIDFLGDWHTESAFGRGMAEYAQDYCEGIHAEAGKTGVIVVPDYILPENREEWAAGYRFCMVREFGAGWSARMVELEKEAAERHAEWERTYPKEPT